MMMTSYRPYMIRALHEWMLDNNCTPYILVNAFIKGVEVPQDYVKDGEIVLNISPRAIKMLNISNSGIEFEGRFGGIPTRVYVPTNAVLGIYARENGQGMMFDDHDPIPEPPSPATQSEPDFKAKKDKSIKPTLRVVK
jgi:stringent starvation protein B